MSAAVVPLSPADAAGSPARLHVLYAQHDVAGEETAAEGQGVNKPVVRKRRILHALQDAAKAKQVTPVHVSFQAVTEAAPSLKAAECVHSPRLLNLFATGWDRWVALGEGRNLYFTAAGRVSPPDWSELMPSQVSPRHDGCQRPGNSVHSEVNYFAQCRTTPITQHTSRILHHDLAVTLAAVDAVLKDKQQQVYACTTQPGHHSFRESYGGYCFINQAAVAAQLLQQSLGKVAVLDVDYHAGNGTMSIFYRDANVFVASLHADPDIEYPYTCGFADQTGEGAGEGTTLNVPLAKDTTWTQYQPELARVLSAIRQFGAKALVVSLGVDTLAGDPERAPLAGVQLHPRDYDEMGQMIRALGVPTIWVQEGGYKLDEAGDIVRHVLVGALAGEEAAGVAP